MSGAAKNKRKSTSASWRVDETNIKVKESWRYYYRAIDKYGTTPHTLNTTYKCCKICCWNFRSRMENIQTSEILDLAFCLENDNAENRYNKSYYHFVKYFEGKEQLTEHDLVVAANFTYGWMPTILNFKSEEFNSAVSILNEAKGLERISDEKIMTLKKLINNSLVGVSKLLHFVNPNVYAIWDSRVCNFLTGMSHKYKVEKIELFWSYLDLCNKVSEDPDFLSIHEKHKKTVGFDFTPMRTVEQIMFISSSEPIR